MRTYKNIIFNDKINSVEKLEEAFSWLKEADIEDAEIEIGRSGQIYWNNGIWNNGTAKYLVWKNGTWNNGTWKNGTWKNGTWNNGEFKGGSWLNGIWNNGVFHLGIWEDGTWNNGSWLDGIWNNGEWNNGKWYNGKWNNGYIKGKISKESPKKLTFQQISSELKTNQFQTPKEIRQIKDPTLYSIADRLARI